MMERIHPSFACGSILSPLRESRANKIPSAPTGKESPLIRKTKHEKMLCILLGMDSETQGATNEIQNPAERIQFMLENHFQRKKPESGYESVMQYVIEDSDLSAAQIEQLRKAVEAGMPAEDILEMAKKRKDVMEIRRCIEFYEMMQQKGKQENVKKSRRTSK